MAQKYEVRIICRNSDTGGTFEELGQLLDSLTKGGFVTGLSDPPSYQMTLDDAQIREVSRHPLVVRVDKLT